MDHGETGQEKSLGAKNHDAEPGQCGWRVTDQLERPQGDRSLGFGDWICTESGQASVIS